jgi:ABC-2 type transport system permease protein
VIRLLLSGLRIHFLQLSRSAGELIAITLWPILYATIAYYMFGAGSDPDVLLTASLGATVMAIWSSVAFSAGGAIELQRKLGTLELLVAAPPPFVAILAPITIATSAIGVYALAGTLLWGRLLFGIPLHLAHGWWFALSLPLAILAIGMLGLLLASTLVVYRAALFLGASFQYPVWLVTGLLIPLSVLPGWVEPFSWALAPTWGISAIRKAALGGSPWLDIALALALGVVYVLLGVVLVHRVLRSARAKAALALT